MAMTGHPGASPPINGASPSKRSQTTHCNAPCTVCHWPGDVPLPKANDLAAPGFTDAMPTRVRAYSLRKRAGGNEKSQFLKIPATLYPSSFRHPFSHSIHGRVWPMGHLESSDLRVAREV